MFCHIIFVSVLLFGFTYGQGPEWGPDDLKNPITHALQCGFASSDPAYICDPDNILGKDLHAINWILKDAAYNSTQCPCSTYYCETRSKPTGYRIGVALVNKMKVMTSTDGKIISPVDQSQIFAYTLENSNWNMGNCEEDIVVFYSKEDKMLAIYAGMTASQRLTPYYKDLIAHKAGSRLESGKIVEGLNHIIHDIKVVLKCASLEQSDCNLYEFRQNTAAANQAFVSLALIATVAAVLGKQMY